MKTGLKLLTIGGIVAVGTAIVTVGINRNTNNVAKEETQDGEDVVTEALDEDEEEVVIEALDEDEDEDEDDVVIEAIYENEEEIDEAVIEDVENKVIKHKEKKSNK